MLLKRLLFLLLLHLISDAVLLKNEYQTGEKYYCKLYHFYSVKTEFFQYFDNLLFYFFGRFHPYRARTFPIFHASMFQLATSPTELFTISESNKLRTTIFFFSQILIWKLFLALTRFGRGFGKESIFGKDRLLCWSILCLVTFCIAALFSLKKLCVCWCLNYQFYALIVQWDSPTSSKVRYISTRQYRSCRQTFVFFLLGLAWAKTD